MSERGDAGYAEEVFAEQVTKDKKEIFMARRSAIEGVFFGEVESLIEQPVHISEEKQREYLALEEQFAATLAEGQKALWETFLSAAELWACEREEVRFRQGFRWGMRLATEICEAEFGKKEKGGEAEE